VPFPPRPVDTVVDTFAVLPDPGLAGTLDGLVDRLRMLKVWAGDPSYEWIKEQVNAAWTAAGRPAGDLAGKTTVVDCFRPGRRRLNSDLVIAVVQALHSDVGYVTQWRQALRVVGGETRAASQVRVEGTLPQPLAGFTGRAAELDQLRQALHHGYHDGGAVVISAIAGMAGVGKTQLAIHADDRGWLRCSATREHQHVKQRTNADKLCPRGELTPSAQHTRWKQVCMHACDGRFLPPPKSSHLCQAIRQLAAATRLSNVDGAEHSRNHPGFSQSNGAPLAVAEHKIFMASTDNSDGHSNVYTVALP
jgi:hypothetical protein